MLLIGLLVLECGINVRPVAAQEDGCKWLLARIHETETIKKGMSRADLLKVFDAVSVRGQAETLALKSSELIQIEVLFEIANLETGSRPSDNRIPILTMSRPMLAPSKALKSQSPEDSNAAWLLVRIREIETVHSGMTLNEFRKLFSQIGGLSDGNEYDLNRCNYVTVRTTFTNPRLPYSIENQDKQKLITTSQPFLTYLKYQD
jgi:hypothetical protein